MRKIRRLAVWMAVVCLTAGCVLCGAAAEGTTYYGTVVCEQTRAVQAPFGGMVKDIVARTGSRLLKGDPICSIETIRTYAPADGTVSAVFAMPGDNLENVKTLYNGSIYIEPTERLSISANTTGADKNANFSITIGQTVYFKSGQRIGTGYVFTPLTTVDPEQPDGYTIRITDGDFYMSEKVTIYRSPACEKKENLGQGKVVQTSPIVVSGGETGSVLKIHVKPGDKVKRGDLLMETVTGSLDPLSPPESGEITAEATGIVASCELSEGSAVEKGATLIKVYPEEALQVAITVSEPELYNLAIGTPVSLTFSQEGEPKEGVVTAINYVSATENTGAGYASYKVYIDFTADETTRMGMLVAVSVPEMNE